MKKSKTQTAFHVEQSFEKCPCCAHSKWSLWRTSKDFFLTQEAFSILSCDECGLLKTYPSPENIHLYYKSSEYISHSDNPRGLINKAYLYVRNYNLRIKYRLISRLVKGKMILDYGGGTGEFVRYMGLHGYESIGYEPNESARNIAISQKGVQMMGDLELSLDSKNYDCITMWHVLEHINDPKEVLSYLFKKLNDSGHLIVAVPNPTSFDSDYYADRWAGLDVPRHLFHYTSSSLKLMVEQYGFKLVKTKGMIFDAFYVGILSQKYNEKNPIFGVLIGGISNILALFKNKNYSSKIYVFVKKGV